ncbi:MAG: hypothetical protein JNL38_10315 [Myxococcales bacterium]|jgi:hypothetical protein|nr:hypothetical protein [Myxococcales bacterium]
MKAFQRCVSTAFALGLIGAAVAAGAGCAETEPDDESADQDVTAKKPLALTDAERREVVTQKATCPFVSTAIAIKKVFVFGKKSDPYAIISGKPGDIASVANAGGGDLGLGFEVVARGNHHKSPVTGKEAPAGMFSLHFPGSLGAHPAHSFILMGDPKRTDSGRIDATNLGRLIEPKSRGGRAESVGGKLVVRRSELGAFVADNVACDDASVTLARRPFEVVGLLGRDIFEFKRSEARLVAAKLDGSLGNAELTDMLEKLLRIAVGNSLVASAAEMGLLATFLEGSEDAVRSSIDPGLAVSDIEGIYAGTKGADGTYDPLTKHFPRNWERQPKTIQAFMKNTVAILAAAATHEVFNESPIPTHSHGSCPNMR